MRTIAILNTSILTAPGVYTYEKQSLEFIEYIIKGKEIKSYVGHEATCQILTKLLNREIPYNREMYEQKPGDVALVFKLKSRAPEGKILSIKEIEEIGYEFYILHRVS